CSHSYALALHPRSLRLLNEVGLEELIRDESYPVRTIGFYDTGDLRARTRVDDRDPNAFVAVVRQSTLEDVFESTLETVNVPVSWRHELAALDSRGDGVSARVYKFEKGSRGYVVAHTEWVLAETIDIDAKLLLGADGYDSQVRHAIGAPFPEV